MPAFPNVPNVPGVPAVNRQPGAAIATTVLMVADALGLFGFLTPPLGLYKDGTVVITADNVVSFDHKRDWALSTYPLEQGAFESYDKVQQPFDVRLRFSAGGSADDRQQLLDSIEAVANSLELFDAVTPEKIYRSVNVIHYDYRRESDRGAGLIVIDVWCQEVRVTATASFSNTQTPSGASTVDGGVVQTQAPTSAQTSTVPTVQ